MLNICMVSDLFYPNLGGVESHIYQLSFCLRKRGHRVVIVTHKYGDRVGIRYVTGGIKVYYLPIPVLVDQMICPTFGLLTLPFLRKIFLKHSVNVVHGHSAFSPLAHEAILIARIMGLHTVFTDHSLFGFANLSTVFINQQLCTTVSGCDHVICVSHMAKENTVLRARVEDPHSVSVIPNAVDHSKFLPKDAAMSSTDGINIVTMTRLVYRRGIDLLVEIIPTVCTKFPLVKFVIGGAGPKRLLLEEMREKHCLQERVVLLGRLELDEVPQFLREGSIYINTSLTEAFCISILEAACVGLLVVSTDVGGIPEVLPPEMIRLANPNAQSLQSCLESALNDVIMSNPNLLLPSECHEKIKAIYSWDDVARRTEIVYDRVMDVKVPSLRDLLTNQYKCCGFFGRIWVIVFIVLHFFGLWFWSWLSPVTSVWLPERTC